MKKTILLFAGMCIVLSFFAGCDMRKAKMDASKKKYMTTPEQARLQEQNRQEVLAQLNAYREDFGQYPQTLDELKQAGYDYPQPSEGWKWSYLLMGGGANPQLMPVPESQP